MDKCVNCQKVINPCSGCEEKEWKNPPPKKTTLHSLVPNSQIDKWKMMESELQTAKTALSGKSQFCPKCENLAEQKEAMRLNALEYMKKHDEYLKKLRVSQRKRTEEKEAHRGVLSQWLKDHKRFIDTANDLVEDLTQHRIDAVSLLRILYEACMLADSEEELSERIDGSLLDKINVFLNKGEV